MSKDWKKELEEYIARIAKKQHLSDNFYIAVADPEFKDKIRAIRKGKPATNKGVPHTEEHKAKLAAAGTGRIQSVETKAKQSEKAKDRVVSDETKAKLSASNKGKPSPKKGIPRPKLTCPHCGQEGGNSSMKRWHFDNCKLKRD